jgi:hypothetical protein
MIKTEYFTSGLYAIGDYIKAINEVQELRDKFLKSSIENISTIKNENIQIINYGGGNNALFAIITLSYFPKI